MKSMTGYARAVVTNDGRELTVEMKSVNHRFLDVNVKLPRSFIAYEDSIRKQVGNFISRGHVDVFVNYVDNTDKAKQVVLDMKLAASVLKASVQLREAFDLKDDFQLNALMRTNDIVTLQPNVDDQEAIEIMVDEAVAQCAEELDKMRQIEGDKLTQVISDRLDVVAGIVGEIAKYAPSVISDYRDKLAERIKDALGNVELDQARLINEVAFFADKASIDEELDRLNSHIASTRKLLKSSQPVGRKLDFLVQEFNRETNTICSKSNNINITNKGVELKNEIEKIREQVQNFE